MKEEVIKIYKRPKLREPILIAAWPGMGEVALRAANYLKEKLKPIEFARLDPSEFFRPTGILIKENLIEVPKPVEGKFCYWRNKAGAHDLIIFTSDFQPSLEKGCEYAHRILDLAQEFMVRRIYTFAAMPVPIDHTKEPEVWATATDKGLIKELVPHQINVMREGNISGLNGLLLGVAKERGFEGICFLGELPLYAVQMENPKSSLAVLKALTGLLDIKVDLGNLTDQAKYVEEQIGKLVEYLKAPDQLGPIKDEEIERIKKELSAFTKLPKSARQKIERLFKEAQRDVSKAYELKRELDKWDAYKEYEDKFLDLFKKKEKGREGKDLG